MTHWADWHAAYDEPGSALWHRLRLVRARIREALDGQPPGPVRVLSMCAGQGRDLTGALAEHPRRADVHAVLVELDPDLAAHARAEAAALGLAGVRVITGDAADTTAYREVVPADLALVCGVFGNVPDADIRATAAELPRLCRPGATVIWTRHRREPDLTPAVRGWFADAGFTETAIDTVPGFHTAVGTAHLTGPALPYRQGVRMFTFDGDGADAHR